MNRRLFLSASSLSFLPATLPVMALDARRVDYSPAAYAEVLASGKPLLLDFFAPW